MPNGKDDPANGIAQFIGTWSNPASIESTSVRLDHVFKERHRLFFRFSDTQSNSSVRGVYTQNETPSSNQITSYTTRTYTAGVTSLVTNRLSNDLRLNYSSNFTTNDFAVDPIAGSAPVDLGQLSGTSGATVALQYGGYQVQLQQLRRDLRAVADGDHDEPLRRQIALRDILDEKIRIEPGRVFDRVVELDGVPEGYRAMNDRESIKVLVKP